MRLIDKLEKLSPCDKEILHYMCTGMSFLEIGKIYFISKDTINACKRRMLDRLDINDYNNLKKFGIDNGYD